jgi:hypothetical protein
MHCRHITLQGHMQVGCEFLFSYTLLTTGLATEPYDAGRSEVGALSSCRKHAKKQAINQLTKEATPLHTGRDKSRRIPVYDTAIPWSLVVCDGTKEQRGILVCG